MSDAFQYKSAVIRIAIVANTLVSAPKKTRH